MKSIHVRKWLNKDKSLGYTGFIHWSVTFPTKKDKWCDAQFELADCSRKVSLALDTGNDYIENSINKLQIIIDEATKCKEALLRAYDLQWKLDKAAANGTS